MLNKHLATSGGKSHRNLGSAGRSQRIIMTSEARVLRELRIQSGLSMRKAGDLLDYSDSYISHIENGRTDFPKSDILDRFLVIYGGIKQRSFYERVRRYTESVDPKHELIEKIRNLPYEKIAILNTLANSL